MSRSTRWLVGVLVGVAVTVGLVLRWATDDYVPSRELLLLIGDVALYASVPPLIGFVLLYGIGSKWWHTGPTRALFFLTLSLLATLGLVASAAFWEEYPGRVYVRMAVYAAVSVNICYLFVSLVKAKLQTRRERRAAAQHAQEAPRA